MGDVDLFGEPIVDDPIALTNGGNPKRSNKATGYAGDVGRGPDGETCRSCKHATCVPSWSKNYWKCGLLKAHWTKGLGSDIRLKSPACQHWEGK